MKSTSTKTVKIINRRATFDYEILERLEAGIALSGAEVKSIRGGRMSLEGSFVRIQGGEAWLYNAYVNPYSFASDPDYDPKRSRKLLLHRHELFKIEQKIKEKGLTVVPIACYNKHGKIKLEIGLARGKKQYEKRDLLRRKDLDREIARLAKNR